MAFRLCSLDSLVLLGLIQIGTSSIDKNSLGDAMALVEFKSTVWYDPLNIFATWQVTGVLGEHACNFKGVECDKNRYRVKFVDISGSQLRGIVPSVLGNITLAWGFNLSNNEFVGSIPKGFGRMPNLKYLDLSKNQLTGFMPVDVFKLQFLRFYSLADNQITGYIMDNLNMSFLQHLDLSNNSFRGSIPRSLGILLPNLTYLNLASNKLSGQIPPTLGYLPELHRLDLSGNWLTGNIPYSLAMATQLRRLRLMYNSLKGRIPDTDTMRRFADTAFFPGNDGLCGPVVERACPHSQIWKKVLMGLFLPPLTVSVLLGFLYAIADEFSLSTIRKLTDNFNNNKILCDGGQCTIYKGVFPNGKTVTVKRLRPEYYNDDDKVFYEERRFLKAISHPNIVKYLGACSSPKLKVLIYEYMANGSLDMHLHKEKGSLSSLSWGSRMDIAAGIAQGLAYLHGEWSDPQAMRCNLRGSTVFLDESFNARISDIRSQNTNPFPSLNNGLSTGYLPPEYSTATVPTREGEIFSFGTLLMELLTGTEPATPVQNGVNGGLQGIVERAFPDNLQSVLDPAILSGASNEQIVLCTKIALECTKTHPSERPRMENILRMFEQAYTAGPT